MLPINRAMATADQWERLMAAVVLQAGSESPYKIFRQGSQYVVKNNAGIVKARFNTRAEALQYQRALYVNVPGAAKKAASTKWTGKATPPGK
jgi:hypothetical protein